MVSDEELWKGYSYLGEVEYGTELNFGFTAEPLSQDLINAGFSIKEEIMVGYEWQGTVVKRSSGAEFDLMKYVSDMGTYQIIYSIHLYKNEEYVTTKGFYYEVDVVTGTADSLAATLDHPVAGNLPSDVVYDDITDLNGQYGSYEYVIIADKEQIHMKTPGREEITARFDEMPDFSF